MNIQGIVLIISIFILFPVLINSVRDGLCFLTPNIQQLYAS
ncbi:hypothetical protein ECP03048163_0108 [Escherichia coli P0304816.3]|nr:hypothetical protein ECP03048164_0108 [Escherichia coli P0304816.4]ENH39980.1 hypothetical protein ECP03048163_0108 [Escherichia coli P0304816.3]ENH44017.1 hypothetical protein ECP03048165_0122 [Escherichia coli P0304816.5]